MKGEIQPINNSGTDSDIVAPKRGRGRKAAGEMARTPERTAVDRQAAGDQAQQLKGRIDREASAIVDAVQEVANRTRANYAQQIVEIVEEVPLGALNDALQAIELSEDRSELFRTAISAL